MAKRVDIVSDTHGHISPALRAAIEGCDLLVHAGDITSEADWAVLEASAPMVKACLGNNDHYFDYGDAVQRVTVFAYEGLRFAVSHYREDLPLGACDVGVCGHTHVANIEHMDRCLVVNPGSATFPRGYRGPTIARLMVEDGQVISSEIIDL